MRMTAIIKSVSRPRCLRIRDDFSMSGVLWDNVGNFRGKMCAYVGLRRFWETGAHYNHFCLESTFRVA